MGKPTGFIEYQRLAEASEPAPSRLKHYREFVRVLTDETGEPPGCALHGLRYPLL
jgi:glutamate synthase (NADPH/NADH) small chain